MDLYNRFGSGFDFGLGFEANCKFLLTWRERHGVVGTAIFLTTILLGSPTPTIIKERKTNRSKQLSNPPSLKELW
ncbi:hypothetical protein SDJN03_05332, partial [Cucurbita argyrosperma subsp. sororia]